MTNRRAVIIAGLCLLVSSGAAIPAHAQDATVMAPIQKFLDAFDAGDTAAAAATQAPSVQITDEFAPFRWGGATAFKDWAAGYDKDAAAKGITDPRVTIGAATRQLIAADHAYVVVPAVYTFKQKGVAMREEAQMTFALTKGSTGWLITAWTWTGPDPSPAG